MKAVAERLAALEHAGLRRRLSSGHGIDLTSNDALGLSRDPRIAAAMRQALDEGLPTGSTGSRLLSGQADYWQALEERFAAWQGHQASLYFATGYSANVGLLSGLIEAGDTVLSDELNHASIIDGLRLGKARTQILPHGDLAAYEKALESSERGAWIVVESVYSMDGDLAPLVGLSDLAQRFGARLIVDEAHATGLFGPGGAGRCSELPVHARPFATVHPCGKALGLSGAFVCAETQTIDLLINKARAFVYSTAPSPLLAPALHAALDRIEALGAARSRPLELAQRLRDQLAGRLDYGASKSQIVPIILASIDKVMAAEQALKSRGWDLRAIRPPSVADGQCRLRVVLRSELTDDQIDRLAKDLIDVA